MDYQVTPAGASSGAGPQPVHGDDLAGLGSRADVQFPGPVQGLDTQRGPEGGRGHRDGHRAVQVVGLALEYGVRAVDDLKEQVTRRAAARPDLPLTGQLDVGPVLDPRGDPTLMVRRVRTRPSASHSGQGRRMTVPNPPHAGHGREVITWPRNERVTWLTSPRPPQTSQVSGWVPGAVPSPEQVGQTTAVSTARSLVAPNAHSDRSSSTRMVAFRPRLARLRGPRVAAPAPKNASMMSLNGNPAAEAARPAAGRRERIGAQVVHLALLGVGEHLVGLGDLLEPLLRLRVGVDVRMQFTGQPPVRLLDLFRVGVPRTPRMA